MTDKQIIDELTKGNTTYLKFLYDYLPDVRRFVLQNSGSEDDAKDLMQEAVIAFYINVQAGKYEHNNLKGYLLTVCRYKWFDKLDKLKRQRDKLQGMIRTDEAEEGNHFEFETQGGSLTEYLRHALDKLGDPCKKLLILTISLKKKMEQIAEQFGYANAHSARQQKLKCLNRLRGFTSYDDLIDLT